ncbi:MAG: hypothetical protein ACERLM_00610 [Acidimicrobiales bacterium]|jgi:hypothetical protein
MTSTTTTQMRCTTRLETSPVDARVMGLVSGYGSDHQAFTPPVGTCAVAWINADATATSTDPVTKATRRARSSSP